MGQEPLFSSYYTAVLKRDKPHRKRFNRVKNVPAKAKEILAEKL
jgi:hypothetical protein